MTSKKEKNGIEGVASNLSDFFLSDFSESQGCAALKIDILGEREGGQSLKW